jgi:hypothetical protein
MRDPGNVINFGSSSCHRSRVQQVIASHSDSSVMCMDDLVARNRNLCIAKCSENERCESRERIVAMHAQSREKKVSDGAGSEAEVVWIGCNSQQVPLCRLVARQPLRSEKWSSPRLCDESDLGGEWAIWTGCFCRRWCRCRCRYRPQTPNATSLYVFESR